MKLTTTELILVGILSSVINRGARTEDEADYIRPQDSSTETKAAETDAAKNAAEKVVKTNAEGTTNSMRMSRSSSTLPALCSSVKSYSSAPQTISPALPTKLIPQQPHHGSTLPPLPFGEDTFDEIRREGKLFVDKTPFICKLIEKGKPKLFVLTRPKRFGKSVFLQMMRRFLEGKEELFKNTEIAKRGNGLKENEGWEAFPVIYIDFEKIPVTSATQFRLKLQEELERIAASYPGLPKRKYLNVGDVIQDLKTKTGKPVSILVDNYDLPIMDVGLSPKLRKQVTSILAKFYGQIRANIEDIRLGLAIGISKLNILSNGHARFTDLTFDERFSSIMGFNSKEVGQHLRPYFERLDDGSKNRESETIPRFEEARKWYGGHQFAVGNEITKTLNPASTCECLRKKKFGDYMGNAALVSLMKDKMMKSNVPMSLFEDYKMEVSELQMFNQNEDEISLPLFMLCNGFLSIKNYNKKSEVVSLGYPNDEIRRNLVRALPQNLVGKDTLKDYLMKEDVDNFVRLLNEFPFKHLSQSVNLPLTEFMATRQILPILGATGFEYREGEILWNDDEKNEGDLDIHIKLPKSEFIIEMKYRKTGADSILQLIKYIMRSENAFRYRIREDKEIFLLGMNVKPLEYKEKIVTRAQINEWVLLPYKDGKIWMNECKTSPNIADEFIKKFKNRLQKNWKECLTSPKIIW